MSENSNATPLELENAISELSKALVKILDSSPDAGTEEIVEAMIRASALVGSPSKEKIQARRQIITRVFLKSLQPGDGLQEGLPCSLLRVPWCRPGWQRPNGPEAG